MQRPIHYFHCRAPLAARHMSDTLSSYLLAYRSKERSCPPAYRSKERSCPPADVREKSARPQKKASPAGAFVLLCIGTDRITGDSLGPLIGYKLSRQRPANVYVYGTLHDPVHALNLTQIRSEIKRAHPALPVVAVDASLGNAADAEQITLCRGSLLPGSGVDKCLPAVGDVAITGVVSTLAGDAQDVLSAARLDTVMQLADVIAEGIRMTAAAFTDSLPSSQCSQP